MKRWIGLLTLHLVAGGVAVAQPCISVSATALDFGTVRIATYAQQTVYVRNLGTQDLDLNMSVNTIIGDEFLLWSAPQVAIAAGDTNPAAVLVRFNAMAPIAMTGALHLRSNCPVDSHIIIPLAGVGSFTGGLPLEFDLVSPPDSAYVTGDSLRLSWTAFRTIQPLVYRIALHPPFGPDLAIWVGEDTVHAFGWDELDSDAWFTWRVDAIYGLNEESSLSARHFHTPPAGPYFHLLSPPDQAVLFAPEETFAWHTMTPDTASPDYELWITAADSSGGAFTRTYWLEGDTTETVSFAEFAEEADYVWWVIAYTEFDSIVSSERWQFTLTNVAAEERRAELRPERLAITAIYPNPFNPETRINLWVPQAGLVRAEVFDLLGRSVAVLLNAPLGAGAHALSWRAPGATGTYLLKVSDARGGVSVRKLVVMR